VFESALASKLKRIFDVDKSTFNLPSDIHEQECLFIQVDNARSTIKEGRQVCRVTGKLRYFANTDKLPYGYFAKKIQEAVPADTRNLFFYDIEENAGTFLNIAERSMSFVYFFDSQYDPDLGTLNEVTFEVAE